MGRLLAATLAIMAICCSTASALPDPKLAAAAKRALVAEMTALVVPAGVSCPLDDAGWAAVHQHAREVISAAFAEPMRGHLLGGMLRSNNRSACVLAGGVDVYEPGSARENGESATVTARVGIWNRFTVVNQVRAAEPHNLEDCTFELSRSDLDWLVARYQCTFVPGHGP